MYFIFLRDKVIGFTTSWQEADDICIKDPRLTWKFTNGNVDGLQQLTIYTIID